MHDHVTRASETSERDRENYVETERKLMEKSHHLDDWEQRLTVRARALNDQERKVKERERYGQTGRLVEDYERVLSRIRQERGVAKKEAREAQDRLRAYEETVDKLKNGLHAAQTKLRQTQGHASSLEEQLLRQQREMDIIRNGSLQKESQHEQTRALLDARTQELKGSQSFLTKADLLSGAEVTAMVEGLNAEILQVAAFMSDSFKFSRVGRTANYGDTYTEARGRARELLGDRMLQLLSSVRHNEDPSVIQMALQAAMTKFVHYAVASWHVDRSKDHSILDDIYSKMRIEGKQHSTYTNKALTAVHRF